ncbi:MAG: urease accessory protein UreH [Acidobacteria bacterium]|nr:urease accessory protein UreH [Acidobacteriota bacterium]MBI3655437.1 urease accessory protein UreH [Acidobacteriota bacterium]
MISSTLIPLGLGFVLGLQHALDPDHLVAVSTIVSEHKSLARSSAVGAFWGLGHTASLLICGVLVIGFRMSIPDQAAPFMEFGVAVMLVILGSNLVRKQFGAHRIHSHEHRHDGHSHTHFHVHSSETHQLHHAGLGVRPFIVGMVHGLAGSAALMLLVLTQIPSPYLGLLYIAVFGIGSIGGMLMMSAMIGVPFVWSSRRFTTMNHRIRMAAGLLSIAFGGFLMWKIGFAGGLFRSLSL